MHFNDTLWENENFESRAASPENPTGERGAGAMSDPVPGHPSERLGKGWKCRPCIHINAGETAVLAELDGPGIVRHIWMTCDIASSPDCLPWNRGSHRWRDLIIRIYWDDQTFPSVECPVGDFFACGLEEFCQVNSAVVTVNPGQAFNCFWDMPFRKHCRITLENRSPFGAGLFYQIDYQLRDLPELILYFHSQFRRSNPTEYKKPHVILDGVNGEGKYVGTYMTWTSNSNGWWGEGEVKFYLDGDREYPTICGTGTEDYFLGSNNFENAATGQYQEFSTMYSGMPQVIRPDGVYHSQTRFGLYRWHIKDAIYFRKNIRVDVQALGWSRDSKYRCLRDDVCSVAYWYQTLPTGNFPELGTPDELALN